MFAKVLMDKVGKLEFPDALLKRIMLLNNEEKRAKNMLLKTMIRVLKN